MNNTEKTLLVVSPLKSALLAALKADAKVITVEGFGELRIHALTPGQSEEVQKGMKDDQSKFWFYLIIACVHDLSGNRIFDESDFDVLQNTAGNKQIEILASEAMIINGYKKAPDEKNLQTTTQDGSSSV